MSASSLFRRHFLGAGYGGDAIIDDYVFSDVMAATPYDRYVSLAAFTHTPASYRTAAFAAVTADGRDAATIVGEHRALGAPLMFVIEAEEVSVWQVRSQGAPIFIVKKKQNELAALFAQHRQEWSPLSIQRAKSIGEIDKTYQLDFVDAGLMPAIEGVIHDKLDRLLNDTLVQTVRISNGLQQEHANNQVLFRTIFRLLAAKVLQDRGHELSGRWDPSDLGSVLDTISEYYKLPSLPGEQDASQRAAFSPAWEQLRRGISFRNISVDDLAFVYENTLVMPETRKYFGTHSTPRQVAEYLVRQLELWRHDQDQLRIYEPFAGAGVLLVAALRQVRENLPPEWSPLQRHEFLVKRLFGDEIDAFAAEVAVLSLILADYPNTNGWKIATTDLFQDFRLAKRAREANIIVCNPPFEDFLENERPQYSIAGSHSHSKPIAILEAVLDARPLALGFVLPYPFLEGASYEMQRRRLEATYGHIEVVSLPDRLFRASVVRSSLLIARDLRPDRYGVSRTTLCTTVVNAEDRERFLRTGEVSQSRTLSREQEDAGKLWIGELDELWRSLGKNRLLNALATVRLGIQWKHDQAGAVRSSPAAGFVPGIHAANAVRPFALSDNKVWLDARPERLYRKAINLPWDKPKILANAARLSRGPWCIAAAVDRSQLVASQQLFGIWSRPDAFSLEALCAVINSPLGNAFVAEHSPPDRIRVITLRSLPLPAVIPEKLDDLVRQYMAVVTTQSELFATIEDERANAILAEIDAIVLRAYNLPNRLERKLLDYVASDGRRTLHHGVPRDMPGIPRRDAILREERQATLELEDELAAAAGGLLSAQDVDRLFGSGGNLRLEAAIAERELLSVDVHGARAFPACQFEGGRVLNGISDVLKAAPETDGWRILQFLTGTPDGLDGRRPIDLLRSGNALNRRRVVALARTLED